MRNYRLQHLSLVLCISSGCQEEEPISVEGIDIVYPFDTPICGGTLDWIESRLSWLAEKTGVPKSAASIVFHWLGEDAFEHCPTGACTIERHIYSPLEVFSHELVHAHLAQLGHPRPWLSEGMAVILADDPVEPVHPPQVPSYLITITESGGLDYAAAGTFVLYLTERFGMKATIDLYRRADGADEAETRLAFSEVFSVDFDTVENDFVAASTAGAPFLGSFDCSKPSISSQNGTRTLGFDASCDSDGALGPYLGWSEQDKPYSRHMNIVDLPADGVYQIRLRSDARVTLTLQDCAGLSERQIWSEDAEQDLELQRGLLRITVSADLSDSPPVTVDLVGPT